MSGTPAAATAESPPARKVCANCGLQGAHKRCNKCKKRGIAIYYCGRTCQLSHWKNHKKHCGTAQANAWVELAEGEVDVDIEDKDAFAKAMRAISDYALQP